MFVLYIFLFWILPFILYLCYPIILVYINHVLTKDNKHYTVGDLLNEVQTDFYNDKIYADMIFGTVFPIFNWIWLFFILKEEFANSQIHCGYVKYIRTPICKIFTYMYKVIQFIISPIIYICKVIGIGMSEVKRYIYNIQII